MTCVNNFEFFNVLKPVFHSQTILSVRNFPPVLCNLVGCWNNVWAGKTWLS